jgi:hypothetical protein
MFCIVLPAQTCLTANGREYRGSAYGSKTIYVSGDHLDFRLPAGQSVWINNKKFDGGDIGLTQSCNGDLSRSPKPCALGKSFVPVAQQQKPSNRSYLQTGIDDVAPNFEIPTAVTLEQRRRSSSGQRYLGDNPYLYT